MNIDKHLQFRRRIEALAGIPRNSDKRRIVWGNAPAPKPPSRAHLGEVNEYGFAGRLRVERGQG